MDVTAVYLSVVVFITQLCGEVFAITCTKEERGDTVFMTCPRPFIDSPDKIYCCGTEKFRYCCTPSEYSSAINTIGVIVGVLVSAIVVVVIIVVISCFCCSCCLLAKRRQQRGHVIYDPAPTNATVTTTTVAYPGQPVMYPQQPYPTYPQQYIAYPPQVMPGNPPPYATSEQLPYNPGYPPK